MIRLTEELALKIEIASRKSLENLGKSWRALTHQQLLEQRAETLGLLENFNGLEIEQILKSELVKDFLRFCVQLSVCQTLLNNEEIPSGGPRKVI